MELNRIMGDVPAAPRRRGLPRQRDIVDRTKLVAAIGDIVQAPGSSTSANRSKLLDLLKEALAGGRWELRRRFEAGASGEEVARGQTFLIDQLIRVIYNFVAEYVYPAANPTAADRICITAVGGYGRGEMAPFSDVDLLFLVPYKQTPRVEQIVEFMLYMLWDLGLKVGHATRSIDQCIRLSKEDITIKTAIFEARYVWGEKKLHRELRRRFEAEVQVGNGPQFVEEKLAERDARHKRLGDSRYVLEPNIKDGKGGLRDLHTLFWIAKYLYRVDRIDDLVDKGVLTAAEVTRFAKAHRFLWNVRCSLHYIANRAEERLTFDMQPEIGKRLGYKDHAGTTGVERFMKHYYLIAKEVGDLTRIFCAAIEAEHQRRPKFSFPKLDFFQRHPEGFSAEGGRLTFSDSSVIKEDPVRILRLFHLAQERGIDIHPRALKLITRNLRLVDAIRDDPRANQLFVEMLTSKKDSEIALRRLSEAGVFGRFIPDFGRVVAQMQHDMYHVYTVDEHTIFAIGILHGIERGDFAEEMPIATEAIHKIQSRRALFVALLIHDIGKGRGGDHSEIGAEIASRLCPRLGLSEEETETVEWLVRYHLIMSNTAFRRDINDLKTITDFVGVVQSVERLRLLVALTVADIRAVGPNVWNGWKAALLRELYYAAEEVLSGGLATQGRERRVEHAKQKAADHLAEFSDEERERFLSRGYPSYWLSFDPEAHAFHARLLRQIDQSAAPLLIETRVDAFRSVTEVTIITADHPGLFSRITGAMAISGANIVDAKIFTLTDGLALDTFWIQDTNGAAFSRPDKLAKLSSRIERTLSGRLRPMQELSTREAIPARTQVFEVAPRVLIDNTASNTNTVVEVNGRDRSGLLYDLTRALTSLNVQIASAHIATFGEKAVDVFYIKDLFGLKITHEERLKQIRETLLAALEGRDVAPPAPVRAAAIGSARPEAAE